MRSLLLLVLLSSALFSQSIHEINENLGRGVNLGNMFEPPKEGDWGTTMEWDYIDTIAAKGFTHLRVPVRWQTHFDSVAPLTIDPTFLSRIDTVIDRALKCGMYVMVDAHHYESLYEDPAAKRTEFMQLWSILSNHYKDYSDSLLFEPLNEPHGNMSADIWNSILAEVIDTIRLTNPTRPLVVGLAEYGGLGGLSKLVIPTKETRAIVSLHYYLPFQFTHQGAEWVGEHADDWLGTTWEGDYQEKMDIFSHLDQLKQYSDTSGRPVHIGEFGAYNKAPMESRARWTEFCARAFEKYGFPWTYWEFCAGFGVYDPDRNQWRDELVDPLLSNDTTVLELVEDEYEENSLINGDFSDGMKNWTFGVWNKDSGNATQKLENEASHVTVTEITPNSWEIQLIYKYISIKKGEKYKLSFDCSSSDAGQLSVGITSDGDYINYFGSATLSPSTEIQKEQMQFTSSADRDSVMIAFSFGHKTGNVTIDNVSLQKKISDSPVVEMSNLKSNALISNLRVSHKTIRFTNNNNAKKFTLISANGSVLHSIPINKGAQKVVLPDTLSKGIYFMKVGTIAKPIVIE